MTDAPRRGWIERHWVWLVPLGCVGTAGLVALLFAGILASVFLGMRASWPYQEALETAREDRRVVAELGQPIEAGFFIGGSIHVSGPSGEAELSIPLRGPQGRATLYVVAYKHGGEWHLDLLQLEVRGLSERIDLLSEPARSEAPMQARLSGQEVR